MLGEAIQVLRSLPRHAGQRADAFEALAAQIEVHSGGAWQARRSIGTDGAEIFLGRLGEGLVVAPAGRIFRGRVGQNIHVTPAGVRPDYAAMQPLD
jgi:hypothetical protein